MFRRSAAAGVVAAILAATAACGFAQPTNVIFFIGDGMGFEHVKAGGMFANGQPGSLCFEGFPYQGQVTTYSASSSITDSAAAATAIATGVKVNNGVISMAYPGNGAELETLLEYFRDRGRSTGLVTTTYITHATPAGFGAHEPSRNNTSQIAGDYLNQTRPNVLVGGGANGMSAAAAQAAGYTVVTTAAEMLGLDTDSVSRLSGQFGSSYLPYEYDGLGVLPHLSQMTQTALSILDNDADGFFLMVEGGLIDQASHNRDILRAVPEVVEFAAAVQAALNWAQGRSDTLILVTADHETGGLTVLENNGQDNYPTVSWLGSDHTAANVPIYAWGANADAVWAVMDNTELFAAATRPGKGDANSDGQIDGADYTVWSDHYGWSGQPAWSRGGWQVGNFTEDGTVDGADYTIWADSYTGGLSLAGAGEAEGASLPEPAGLSLLAAGAALLGRRGRRAGRRS